MRTMFSAVLFSLVTLGSAQAAPSTPVRVSADPADLVGCDTQHPDTRSGAVRYHCEGGAYLQLEGTGSAKALVRHEPTAQPPQPIPATGTTLSAYAMSDDQWNARGVKPEGCVRAIDPDHPDWFTTCKVMENGVPVQRFKRDAQGREIPGTRYTIASTASSSSDDCGRHLSGRPSQEVAYREGTKTGCIAVREKSRVPELLATAVVLGVLEAGTGGYRYGRGRYHPTYYGY